VLILGLKGLTGGLMSTIRILKLVVKKCQVVGTTLSEFNLVILLILSLSQLYSSSFVIQCLHDPLLFMSLLI